MNDQQKQIADLTKRVADLEKRRIYQQDIVPNAVKERAMGEANRYVKAGLLADRPEGFTVTNGVTAYFATDALKLYIWDGTAYVSVTLT